MVTYNQTFLREQEEKRKYKGRGKYAQHKGWRKVQAKQLGIC